MEQVMGFNTYGGYQPEKQLNSNLVGDVQYNKTLKDGSNIVICQRKFHDSFNNSQEVVSSKNKHIPRGNGNIDNVRVLSDKKTEFFGINKRGLYHQEELSRSPLQAKCFNLYKTIVRPFLSRESCENLDFKPIFGTLKKIHHLSL